MTSSAPPSRFTPSQYNLTNIHTSLDYHGYCILQDFLPNPAQLRHDFQQNILNHTPTGRNRFEGEYTKRAYSLFAKTRAFDSIVTNPFLLQIIEDILESKHFLLSSTVGISIGPGERAQPLHRDDGKYPVGNLVRGWPHKEIVFNCIIAIDDFTAGNGGTILYPGSHQWEYEGENEYATQTVLPNTLTKRSSTQNDTETKTSIQDIIPQLRDEQASSSSSFKNHQKISCEMKAGSIMLYRGSLLHGGGENKSKKPRLGVLLEFVSAWLRPQENHLIGVPKEIVKTLPLKLQEMLGWCVSPPFIGYVDGRDPKSRL